MPAFFEKKKSYALHERELKLLESLPLGAATIAHRIGYKPLMPEDVFMDIPQSLHMMLALLFLV
jgi:hypothetical protein